MSEKMTGHELVEFLYLWANGRPELSAAINIASLQSIVRTLLDDLAAVTKERDALTAAVEVKDEVLQDLADTLDEDGSFPYTVQVIRAAIAATYVDVIARKGPGATSSRRETRKW